MCHFSKISYSQDSIDYSQQVCAYRCVPLFVVYISAFSFLVLTVENFRKSCLARSLFLCVQRQSGIV